jgi:hypothetical protein
MDILASRLLAAFRRTHYIVPKDHRTYRHLLARHFRGHTDSGEAFVYCPAGNIVSWSPADYEHSYCGYCQAFFEDLRRDNDQTTR